jgi:hypothetical protein
MVSLPLHTGARQYQIGAANSCKSFFFNGGIYKIVKKRAWCRPCKPSALPMSSIRLTNTGACLFLVLTAAKSNSPFSYCG